MQHQKMQICSYVLIMFECLDLHPPDVRQNTRRQNPRRQISPTQFQTTKSQATKSQTKKSQVTKSPQKYDKIPAKIEKDFSLIEVLYYLIQANKYRGIYWPTYTRINAFRIKSIIMKKIKISSHIFSTVNISCLEYLVDFRTQLRP